jgi:iron-sulfur cluster assembly protein
METTISYIQLSPNAKEEFARLKPGNNSFFRLDIAPGGCSGMSYQLFLDEEHQETDIALYSGKEFTMVTSKESFPLLVGLTIDFSKDLINHGFRFENPNAVESCGCGHSAKFA